MAVSMDSASCRAPKSRSSPTPCAPPAKPDDDVIAPSFICFEANRRELIRYPETYGVYREAKAEYDRDGFFAARRNSAPPTFSS